MKPIPIKWNTSLLILLALLAGCQTTDMGTATTKEADFTVEVSVKGRFIHTGDQLPVVIQLRRTDRSNLETGNLGEILLTSSAQGSLSQTSIPIQIADEATTEFVKVVVFNAQQAGLAQVRGTFLDATAQIEIVISDTNF